MRRLYKCVNSLCFALQDQSARLFFNDAGTFGLVPRENTRRFERSLSERVISVMRDLWGFMTEQLHHWNDVRWLQRDKPVESDLYCMLRTEQ